VALTEKFGLRPQVSRSVGYDGHDDQCKEGEDHFDGLHQLWYSASRSRSFRVATVRVDIARSSRS